MINLLGAFDGMSSLLEVKLDRNKLQHLPAEGLFASSLHHVEVNVYLPHISMVSRSNNLISG